MCARQKVQKAVAALQRGRDQPRAGVVFVAPEASADEEADGVRPAGSRG